MVARWMALAGLGLTLILPIYPEGLTPQIVLFGGLAVAAGGFGLVSKRARVDAVLIAPWLLALLLAFAVAAGRGTQPRQAFEDAAPFLLFALGLMAGRGADAPRRILEVALAVCVIDALASLWNLPSLGPGIRSTYFYFKITAGLPLVGIYLAATLWRTPAAQRRPLRHAAIVVVLWVALLATVSRGMILAGVLGVFVAAYLRRPSAVLLWLAGAAAVALAASSSLVELGVEWLRIDQASTVEGRVREVHTVLAAFASAPLFGEGLGAHAWVDGRSVSFVHNLVAYHLWKFGIVGCALLAAPAWWLLGPIRRSRADLRAVALGASVAVLAYLVTSAAYKTYYLVWILGLVLGASSSWFELLRHNGRQPVSAPPQPPDRSHALRPVS